MRTAGRRINSAACEISALRRVVSGSRQAAPQLVEEVQQDGCVDRGRLRAAEFRRSKHYKAPAVRCDVQIPKGVVSWPEERPRRPQPGFLGDEGALLGI